MAEWLTSRLSLTISQKSKLLHNREPRENFFKIFLEMTPLGVKTIGESEFNIFEAKSASLIQGKPVYWAIIIYKINFFRASFGEVNPKTSHINARDRKIVPWTNLKNCLKFHVLFYSPILNPKFQRKLRNFLRRVFGYRNSSLLFIHPKSARKFMSASNNWRLVILQCFFSSPIPNGRSCWAAHT